MGRGRSGVSLSTAGIVTAEQQKAINRIAKRTANLKNEQYRVIGADGEVLLEKKGTTHEVAHTVGESREYIPGSVTIHNHPEGGTFSDADIRDFGYRARAIYATTPEGTYSLVNTKYGTKDVTSSWIEMQEAYRKSPAGQEHSFLYYRDKAAATPTAKRLSNQIKSISDKWVKAREEGKPKETTDKLLKQFEAVESKYKAYMAKKQRELEVAPAHEI